MPHTTPSAVGQGRTFYLVSSGGGPKRPNVDVIFWHLHGLSPD